LRRVRSDQDPVAFESTNAFPGNLASLPVVGPALDEAGRSAAKCDDSAAVAVNFMDAAESLAVEGRDYPVA